VSADETEALAGADVVVTASLGQVTAPAVLVRALGAGAVPVAARLPVYEEVLQQGDLGLLFEPADVEVLAQQLERIVADADLRASLAERGAAARADLSWTRVADETEQRFPALSEGLLDAMATGSVMVLRFDLLAERAAQPATFERLRDAGRVLLATA
jgi:glycosyltransferase involved in cell wall biosynthesis